MSSELAIDIDEPLQFGSSEAATDQRLDDLGQIIGAYNAVTAKLQHSHEALRQQVVKLRHQLVSADVQLQRSRRLAAVGEMAAGIAHEIRNPLAAITLYTRMVIEDLQAMEGARGEGLEVARGECRVSSGEEAASMSKIADEPGEDAVCSALQNAPKISAAVRGLNAVVTDVLNFAREIQPRATTIGLHELVSRAIDAQQPAMNAAGVKLVMAVTHAYSAHVDPDLMHQVLLNLIRNAVDAMTHGGTLSISAVLEGEHVALTIRDTGPGISQTNVDRIFNPFFTTRNTGTGLGLAIVHRIMDAHDGAIAVANDGGAVFTLSLPTGRTQSAGA